MSKRKIEKLETERNEAINAVKKKEAKIKKIKSRAFKITEEKQKELEKIAGELPKFQRIDGAGNPLTKKTGRYIKGSEVPIESRSELKNFSEEKTYKTYIEEPVLINHAIAIRLCYLQRGQEGADAYCKFYNDLYDEQMEKTINGMTK